MRSLKIALVAATALGGASLIAPAASAMPISGLAPAANELATDVQQTAWVCGPFRCWWRPGWGYGYRRWLGPAPLLGLAPSLVVSAPTSRRAGGCPLAHRRNACNLSQTVVGSSASGCHTSSRARTSDISFTST